MYHSERSIRVNRLIRDLNRDMQTVTFGSTFTSQVPDVLAVVVDAWLHDDHQSNLENWIVLEYPKPVLTSQ